MKDNEVVVNGQPLPREPAPLASLGTASPMVKGELFEETNAGRRYWILFASHTKPLPDYPEAKVPDGMCFVLGDNRNNSRDSRTMGSVALGDVLGEVQYTYWPAATWTRFGALTDESPTCRADQGARERENGPNPGSVPRAPPMGLRS